MSTSPRWTRWWPAAVAAWCIAFAVALLADAPLARWVRVSGTASLVLHSPWAWWVKLPGEFWFTAVVVVALLIAKQINGRQAAFVFAAAALAGLNVVPKWIVGRTRPFKLPPITGPPQPFRLHPCWHGLPGLFNQHDLSFPSGHECTAFALAAAMTLVWPRGAWSLLLLALAVGVERVAENAHYPSDVVGAVGFAAAATALAWGVMSPWVRRPNGFTGIMSGDEPPHAGV